jgi:hypothetical protein
MKTEKIKTTWPYLQGKNTPPPGYWQKDFAVYILIGLTVIFFNLIAIFGLEVLLHDDPMWYTLTLEGKFPKYLMKFSPLSVYKEWIAWNIMAVSPQLARGLYVLMLMVPVSCCFYYLLHTKFGFSRLAAFTAAGLPNILPHHWQIPAGINMSYTLWGLLFLLLALMMGFYYLEHSTPKNWLRLLGAVILYSIALQLMEQALFLFPPLVLAFWGYTKFNRKHIWLVSCFFICAAAKFIHWLIIPRKSITDVSLEEIITRIGLYFKWALPSPDIKPAFTIIAFTVIVIIGFLLAMRQTNTDENLIAINKDFSHWKKKGYFLYLYLFFICWAISGILVIILFSRPYQIRYVHISAFGLNALFILSLYVIVNRGLARKLKLYIPVLIGIIIFSGVYRYDVLDHYYSYLNHTRAIIVRELEKVNLPENAQVVITGIKNFPENWLPGGWERASGYLKHVLKRKDITGLIGPINSSEYYNFDNHFNPHIRGFREKAQMRGLSIDKPVFLYSFLEKQQKLKQFEYALQWNGRTKNAPWTILRVNKKTGEIKPFLVGTGLQGYLEKLKQLGKKGIRQSEILWGGPPTEEELKRLQRL